MRASHSSLSACAISLLLLACGPGAESNAPPAPAAEEQLESLLPDLVDAIQAKQPLFVMEHVAETFMDERGLDYIGLQSLVDTYAFHDDEVGALLQSVAISPSGKSERRVTARVAFALGQRLAENAPLPPGAVVYAFDVVFAKNGARWQAIRGSYRRE